MSLGTEIIWFTKKQQELSELQISYGMAQSVSEREELIIIQQQLINQVRKQLKGKVTLHMTEKIINQMIIKEFHFEI